MKDTSNQLTKTMASIDQINDKLKVFDIPNDPSSNADDLSACAYADRDPL